MKKTKAKKISVEKFDQLFDEGKDITPYLDMSSIRKPGLEMPTPGQIAMEENSVKITLSISELSRDFFKNQAEKTHTSYQKLIRRVLDAYAKKNSNSLS